MYSTLLILMGIFVWFKISYSPLKMEFEKEYNRLSQNININNRTFSNELLVTKPEQLQKYIKYCGLYNQPMMKYSFTVHNNADFLLNDNSPMIKIKYEHVNFAEACERLAFVDTKIARVLPFQGLDDYIGGKGRMKGVIAKLFTVFHVRGKEMDISALVTVLAEGIVCPSFLMNHNICWQEVDSTHLQATLTQYGISVSGIFEFDSNGAISSFYSKDRYQDHNGKMIQKDWKAECGSYIEIDGIKRPSFFKGIWLSDHSSQVYFDCDNVEVFFQY